MMDGVLEQSDKAHILVAGMERESVFGQKVTKMKNRDRVHIIGTRKYINEVFAHSDIYLSSYPLLGGLMTQYAAFNKLPILAYSPKSNPRRVEELVNHFASPLRSRTTFEEFFAYAKELIESKDLRKSVGQKNHDAMMSYENFNSMLGEALTNHSTNLTWEMFQPDYNYIVSSYLNVENNYTHDAIKILYIQLRLKAIALAPMYIPMISIYVAKIIKGKIFRHLKLTKNLH
jgi:hypothetical protein